MLPDDFFHEVFSGVTFYAQLTKYLRTYIIIVNGVSLNGLHDVLDEVAKQKLIPVDLCTPPTEFATLSKDKISEIKTMKIELSAI